jgi:NADPH:quinone reductase-like Zn-dependent oxidoreductase
LGNAFWGPFTRLVGGKKVLMPIPRDIKGTLEFVKSLVEQRKFTPVIDRVYSMDKIGDAFDYVASQQKVGNVVLTLDD